MNKFETESQRLLEVDIIKMLSAFLVVCHHFGYKTILYDEITLAAVPIFMIFSFYFLFKKLNKNFDIYHRIKRLIIPLFGSTVIYYFIYQFILNRQISASDFLWQTTFGHSPNLNQSMWFSNNLIILTVLVYIFRKCFLKYPVISSLITLMISYRLQYLGYNLSMFSNLREELQAPLGRLVEMLPFISVGCLFAHYNLLYFFKKKKIILVSILLYILFNWLRLPEINDFGYAGIHMMFKSVFLIICINAIPLQFLSVKIRNILSEMCKYTLGIYCFHRLTEACLHEVLVPISGTIWSCFIIYILSYFLCFLISRIPCKLTKMLVE